MDMETARNGTLAFLETMQNEGVSLFLDGNAVLPAEAVNRIVMEDSPYMADYVFGDGGSVVQIRYDRVVNR